MSDRLIPPRLALAVFLLVSVASILGQTQPSPRIKAAAERFGWAVDRTFHEGVPAKLPPHISTLLGITQEQESPVRQGIVRGGTIVRGIDVSVANKKDVVLFVVDEAKNNQTLYLTSADGKLRKVVSVKAGVGMASQITDEHRQAFEAEKKFWADRLARAQPAK